MGVYNPSAAMPSLHLTYATGNHFVLDTIVGAGVAAVSVIATSILTRSTFTAPSTLNGLTTPQTPVESR